MLLLWTLGLVVEVTLAPLGERGEMMVFSYGVKADEVEVQIGLNTSPSPAAKRILSYLIFSISLTFLKFSLFCLRILLLGLETEERVSKGSWGSSETPEP